MTIPVLTLHRSLRYLLAASWLVMGLGCKVLGLVPRHEAIVARILGEGIAPALTIAIGFGEVGIALWILSGIRPRVCAGLQIALVATMNVLEWYAVEVVVERDVVVDGHLGQLPFGQLEGLLRQGK